MGITFFRDAFLAKHGTLVCFTPDDRYMVAAIASRIEFHRLSDGEIVQTLNAEEDIWSSALSRDGSHLAAGDETGALSVWRLSDERRVLKVQAHNAIVHSVSFSPDGHAVATGSYGTARLFHLSPGIPPQTYSTRSELAMRSSGSVTFHPRYNLLITAFGDGTILTWDASPQIPERRGFFPKRPEPQPQSHILHVTIPFGSVNCLAHHPFDDCLAVCIGETIEVWSLSGQPRCLHQLLGHSDTCTSVAWTLHGKLLLSCGNDGKLVLWRVSDGVNVYTHEDDRRLFSVAATSDGSTIAGRHEEAGVLRIDPGGLLRSFLA